MVDATLCHFRAMFLSMGGDADSHAFYPELPSNSEEILLSIGKSQHRASRQLRVYIHVSRSVYIHVSRSVSHMHIVHCK